MRLMVSDIKKASFEQLLDWDDRVMLDLAQIEYKLAMYGQDKSVEPSIIERTERALHHHRRNLSLIRKLCHAHREKEKRERQASHDAHQIEVVKLKNERAEIYANQEKERNRRIVDELRKVVPHDVFMKAIRRVEIEIGAEN